MKLADRGPEIPTEIQEALEDESLVLFCGSGISTYTRLPTFKGLLDQVVANLGLELTKAAVSARSKRQYDRAFGLLELECVPNQVRKEVVRILTKPFSGELSVHNSLLDLARTRNGYRLITTNFDRRFLEADRDLSGRIDPGPKLPLPKPDTWSSVVHLHGLIESPESSGKNLILTASDFGEAYLTDRWASRFITDLFREFVVLFVGYSVSDPVLVYLVDALAAENRRGRAFHKAYAFAPFRGQQEDTERTIWESKGVIPLMYHEGWGHKSLNQTLKKWASLKRGGLTARRQFALQASRLLPSGSHPDLSSQVAWAVSEEGGSVARDFADAEPIPSLDWLKVFWSESEDHPPLCANFITPLVDGGHESLSPVSLQLGRWLSKHIGSASLLRWVIDRGGQLHPTMRFFVRDRLSDPDFEIPAGLRRAWETLSCSRYYINQMREHRGFPQPSLRDPDGNLNVMAIRDHVDGLAPVPLLRHAYSSMRMDFDSEADERQNLEEPQDCFRIELALADRYPAGIVDAINSDEDRDQILVEIADVLTSHLIECLEWFQVSGEAEHNFDSSYIHRPSIAQHPQNRGFHDWVILIELATEAIDSLYRVAPDKATAVVHRWKSLRFPLFCRLVLHAGAEWEEYVVDGIDVLLRDDASALWSIYSQRECLRFLRKSGQRIDPDRIHILIERILEGNPRSMFREDTTDEDFERIRDNGIWLRLEKLFECDVDLPESANRELARLRDQYPWRVLEDRREEFPSWMGDASWGGVASPYSLEDLADKSPRELSLIFRSQPDNREALLDVWRIFASRRPSRVLGTLRTLHDVGSLESDVLSASIRGLAEISSSRADLRIWWLLAKQVRAVSRPYSIAAARAIADWLMAVAQNLPTDELNRHGFLEIWEHAWAVAANAPSSIDADSMGSLTQAMNSPSGALTEALLRVLPRWGATPAGQIPSDLRSLFDLAAIGTASGNIYARWILASRLSYLFSIDPEWAKTHLISQMDWRSPQDAAPLWSCFSWSPHLFPPLVEALGESLADTYSHLDDLRGRSPRRVMCEILPIIEIRMPGSIGTGLVITIVNRLTADDIEHVALALKNLLAASGDNAASLWREGVGPWITRFWPRSRIHATPETSEALCGMALECGQAFPEAAQVIASFVVGGGRSSLTLALTRGSDQPHPLVTEFPEAMIQFLSRRLSEDMEPYNLHGLGMIIRAVEENWAEAHNDFDFRQLKNLAERVDPRS
jgi:hypothetical protein